MNAKCEPRTGSWMVNRRQESVLRHFHGIGSVGKDRRGNTHLPRTILGQRIARIHNLSSIKTRVGDVVVGGRRIRNPIRPLLS